MLRKIMACLLAVVVMVCSGVLAGTAATTDRLTEEERQTERLIADVLSQNDAAVRAMKHEHTYRAFLDRVAAQQKTWVDREVARTKNALNDLSISPNETMADLEKGKTPAEKDLYQDICKWLIGEKEDSSVLRYSLFTTTASIADLDLATLLSWSAMQNFVDTVVPELLRQALDLLRQLGIDLGGNARWQKLDAKKIGDYAHKYAKKYNPEYRVPDSGSDCTNFVSQALYAGGLPMNPSSIRGTDPGTRTTTTEWYYYNSPSATNKTPYEKAVGVSTSWVRVVDLYTYLAPHFDTLESTDESEVAKNLQAGYVIQGAPLVGRYEHSAIVTEKNGKWCYTAHTNDRKDRNMKHYYNAYDRFRIIKVC